jgi:hypothetical protein
MTGVIQTDMRTVSKISKMVNRSVLKAQIFHIFVLSGFKNDSREQNARGTPTRAEQDKWKPSPHVQISPTLVSVAVWAPPALASNTSSHPRLLTRVGVIRSASSPKPSDPNCPQPMVYTSPSSVTRAVCEPPQDTAISADEILTAGHFALELASFVDIPCGSTRVRASRDIGVEGSK